MTVEFADREPNGLAELVGELIRANLEREPARRALLRPGSVGIHAPDADVAATLELLDGRVRVANGLGPDPLDVLVRADAAVLLELPAVPLRLGLPDPVSGPGRELLGRLARGEVAIDGMFRHPAVAWRFVRLLAVG